MKFFKVGKDTNYKDELITEETARLLLPIELFDYYVGKVKKTGQPKLVDIPKYIYDFKIKEKVKLDSDNFIRILPDKKVYKENKL